MIKVNNKPFARDTVTEPDATDERTELGKVTTTTNAVTTVWSWKMPDNTVACLDITLVGRRSGTAGRALFRRSVIVYREAGTVTVGTPDTIGTDVESTAGYDITIDMSSTTVRVRATGNAGHSIKWNATVRLFSAAS